MLPNCLAPSCAIARKRRQACTCYDTKQTTCPRAMRNGGPVLHISPERYRWEANPTRVSATEEAVGQLARTHASQPPTRALPPWRQSSQTQGHPRLGNDCISRRGHRRGPSLGPELGACCRHKPPQLLRQEGEGSQGVLKSTGRKAGEIPPC